MLALVDYGAGNLASVRKGLAAAGAAVFVPDRPADLERARGIVVPGVGHFQSTAALAGAWTEAVGESVARGVPLLGICLGMQWLFEGSREAPGMAGLGIFPGECVRLASGGGLKVPHVGWNSLELVRRGRLLDGVAAGDYVYFTHAYAAPATDVCCASTTHGSPFAAAVERDNVFGVQFHPEKSGEAGLRILKNFTAIADAR